MYNCNSNRVSVDNIPRDLRMELLHELLVELNKGIKDMEEIEGKTGGNHRWSAGYKSGLIWFSRIICNKMLLLKCCKYN